MKYTLKENVRRISVYMQLDDFEPVPLGARKEEGFQKVADYIKALREKLDAATR